MNDRLFRIEQRLDAMQHQIDQLHAMTTALMAMAQAHTQLSPAPDLLAALYEDKLQTSLTLQRASTQGAKDDSEALPAIRDIFSKELRR